MEHLQTPAIAAGVLILGALADVVRRRIGRWADAVLDRLGRLADLPATVDNLAAEFKAGRADHERRIVRLEHHTGLENPS